MRFKLIGAVLASGALLAAVLSFVVPQSSSAAGTLGSVIVYASGAGGNATATSNKVTFGTTGSIAPVQVGTDTQLDGTDHSKVDIVNAGIYSISWTVAENNNTTGPMAGCQAILRVFGSQNSDLDNLLSPYSGGGLTGAVCTGSITQSFAANDYFQLYAYGETPKRVLSATTTNGSDSVTAADIQAIDQGEPVTGTGIPANTYVGTVTAGSSFLLSSSKTSQVNVNATATATITATVGNATWAYESAYTFVNVQRVG